MDGVRGFDGAAMNAGGAAAPARYGDPASDRTAWPADWPERLAGKDCAYCRELGGGDNGRGLSVHVGAVSEVYLRRDSPVPGCLVVVWNRGHIADVDELEQSSADRYWLEVVAAAAAVQKYFRPIKLNIMMLGNFEPHLHAYILPRYEDDLAPGGPMPWDVFYSHAERGTDDERWARILRAHFRAR